MTFCIGNVHSRVLFTCYLKFGPYGLNYLFYLGASREDLQSFKDFCALSIQSYLRCMDSVEPLKNYFAILVPNLV